MLDIVLVLATLIIVTGGATALELPPGVLKLIEHQQQIALSISFLTAFIGGIITFTSPCGFVIIPTFLSSVFRERQRILVMTACFSVGLTIAFLLFGFIAGVTGTFFNEYKTLFAGLSGIVLVVFGVMLLLNRGFSLFSLKKQGIPKGRGDALTLGFFFAIGWTPCVGPILGGLVVLAAGVGSILKATLLFGFYALGVTVPLLVVAYLSDRYNVAHWFTSRHVSFSLFGRTVHTHLSAMVGGVVLIVIGLIMFLWNGTGIFMDVIPAYFPWTMDFFVEANNALLDVTWVTGMLGDVVGVLLGLVVVYVIVKSVWKGTQKRE